MVGLDGDYKMSTTAKDVEVTVVGLTFIVDYRYTEGCSATYDNPEDLAEVEILSVFVKGQPEADADSVLTAVKVGLKSVTWFQNGYDLIEAEIKEMHG